MNGEFRILLVCTANICRSAMAEVITRAMLAGTGLPAATGSAGVHALTGHPMAPHALATLARLGLDGRAHRARQLDPELVRSADLLLTMEAGHAAVAVGLDPAATPKTFTLPEFAALAAGTEQRHHRSDTAQRARAIVESAAGRRRRRPAPDVRDPYGGPPEGYDTCAKALGESLSHTLGALLGPR
ncbi:hypothetical protein ABGB14_17140 [Nonomuraea sp. B10E15]|uniref:arsenate reductase/protein-tyrosine-phosphatase family protein n=1 Tax=unclassified Nonomuraea TaxID=2593643 RepID=UPI00325DB6D1